METHGAPARLLYRSFRAFLKTRCGDYAVGYERPLSGGATRRRKRGQRACCGAGASAGRLARPRAGGKPRSARASVGCSLENADGV
jgi:hypothetical protein